MPSVCGACVRGFEAVADGRGVAAARRTVLAAAAAQAPGLQPRLRHRGCGRGGRIRVRGRGPDLLYWGSDTDPKHVAFSKLLTHGVPDLALVQVTRTPPIRAQRTLRHGKGSAGRGCEPQPGQAPCTANNLPTQLRLHTVSVCCGTWRLCPRGAQDRRPRVHEGPPCGPCRRLSMGAARFPLRSVCSRPAAHGVLPSRRAARQGGVRE